MYGIGFGSLGGMHLTICNKIAQALKGTVCQAGGVRPMGLTARGSEA
jgi:hypothetical protein